MTERHIDARTVVDPSCGMTIDPDQAVATRTEAGETVSVEFLPEQAGEFEFSCQMGMLRGKLIVE